MNLSSRVCAVLVAAAVSTGACLAESGQPAGQPPPSPTPTPTTPPAPSFTPPTTPAADPGQAVPTLESLIESDQRFLSFASAIKQAGFDKMLAGGGTMTVFAPTNDGFAKLSREDRSALFTPKALGRLKSVLQYHILFNRYDASQLAQQVQVTTSDNRKMAIAVRDGAIHLGPDLVKIVGDPVQCLNGILYPVDGILMPSEHDLLWVIEHEPTIALFNQMLKLTGADVMLKAGRGRYTVLAPTDEALQARLDPEYLQQIMMPERSYELNKIVRRHIFSGSIPSKVLGGMSTLPNLAGEKPAIAQVNGVITINGAKMVRPDIPASNGLLDIVDDIVRLTPPEQEHTPIPPPPQPPLTTDKPPAPATTPSPATPSPK